MRLLKLLAYCLLGYLFYQMYQGMKEGAEGGGQGGQGGMGRGGQRQQGMRSRSSGDLNRALNEDTGRSMNMTGTGRGTTVSTEDNTGMSASHLVGRGVTQP